jgi:GH25 family lysozyme M1 (1,4-beta-N-acetylmuramidase)
VIDSSIKNRYALWIAHWNVSKPGIADEYGIWQYAVGKQTGVAGDCDLDYGYIDYEPMIKKAGKNNWSKKKTINASITVDGVTYTGTLEA